MTPAVRQALLFTGLLLVIFLVHQQVRLQAAAYIIHTPHTAAAAALAWRQAGAGTGLVLQLFAAGAALTFLITLLRQEPGRPAFRDTPGLAPLTDALTDLKARERSEHQQKTAAVARVGELSAVHETVLEGLTSGVLTVDIKGQLVTCNQAALDILGWHGGAPLGQSAASLFRDCPPPVLATLPVQVAAARRLTHSWEPPGVAPRHLGFSLSPIQTPGGKVVAVLFTDLTELKALQRQVTLRRHLAQLGEVSAGIAHEFRNNMGAVLGYARLISHDLEADSPGREVVDAMMGELTDMEGLIRDLLAFGRKSVPQPSVVALAPLVAHAVEVAGAEFDVPVSGAVPSHLPDLWVDEALLRQCLINLVRNACEALQGREQPRIRVGVRALLAPTGTAPEWLLISVADNGPGIAQAERDKVWLPFHTTKAGGTGMGLAHVNKVVIAHGGEVGGVETPGGGASFHLKVPTVHARAVVDALIRGEDENPAG